MKIHHGVWHQLISKNDFLPDVAVWNHAELSQIYTTIHNTDIS